MDHIDKEWMPPKQCENWASKYLASKHWFKESIFLQIECNSMPDEVVSEPRNEWVIICGIVSVRNESERNKKWSLDRDLLYKISKDEDYDTDEYIPSSWSEKKESDDRCTRKEVNNSPRDSFLREVRVGHDRDRESNGCENTHSNEWFLKYFFHWPPFCREKEWYTRKEDEEHCDTSSDPIPSNFWEIHRADSEEMDEDIIRMKKYHSRYSDATKGVKFL